MDARPLKDIFADLVGDASARPDAFSGAGHDLPPDLVAEAVVSFAGTAPAEVAEHLAPFVTANSGVPVEADDGLGEAPDWAELFATAPETDGLGPAELDAGLGPADLDETGIDETESGTEVETGAGADGEAGAENEAEFDDTDLDSRDTDDLGLDGADSDGPELVALRAGDDSLDFGEGAADGLTAGLAVWTGEAPATPDPDGDGIVAGLGSAPDDEPFDPDPDLDLDATGSDIAQTDTAETEAAQADADPTDEDGDLDDLDG